jgi:uncharacterized membrane-anchored protein YhcB (DUF1043 family)
MEGTMQPEWVIYLVPMSLLLVALAFWLGRRSASGVRVRELVAEVDRLRGEEQQACEEARAARAELASAREVQEQYRLDVVEHFSGTSDLLRDMTVQYRAVYDHLTQGASALCPEGFVGLTEGLAVPQLESTGELEPEQAQAAEDTSSGESDVADASEPEARIDPDVTQEIRA